TVRVGTCAVQRGGAVPDAGVVPARTRAREGATMATGAYQINPNAVATVTSNVAGLTSQTGSVVSGLQSAVLDAVSFAQIGSAVGGANTSMHSQLVNALAKIVQLLTQINQNVQTSAQNYAQ